MTTETPSIPATVLSPASCTTTEPDFPIDKTTPQSPSVQAAAGNTEPITAMEAGSDSGVLHSDRVRFPRYDPTICDTGAQTSLVPDRPCSSDLHLYDETAPDALHFTRQWTNRYGDDPAAVLGLCTEAASHRCPGCMTAPEAPATHGWFSASSVASSFQLVGGEQSASAVSTPRSVMTTGSAYGSPVEPHKPA